MNSYKIETDKAYMFLTEWINSVPEVFSEEGVVLENKRNVTKKFKIPGGKWLVVKRYKKPWFFQRIVYSFFRPSKAKRAYSFAQYLLSKSISTPTPVAYIEESSNGIFRYGYLITEYIPFSNCYFANYHKGNDALLGKIAQFIFNMHRSNFLHGDVNLSNFIVDEKAGKLYTIDINRSHIVADKHSASKDQLLRNLFRVSHVPYVYATITRCYAELQHWDYESSLEKVTKGIHKLEQREIRRGMFSGKQPEFLEQLQKVDKEMLTI